MDRWSDGEEETTADSERYPKQSLQPCVLFLKKVLLCLLSAYISVSVCAKCQKPMTTLAIGNCCLAPTGSCWNHGRAIPFWSRAGRANGSGRTNPPHSIVIKANHPGSVSIVKHPISSAFFLCSPFERLVNYSIPGVISSTSSTTPPEEVDARQKKCV